MSAVRIALAGYGHTGPQLARVIDDAQSTVLVAIFDTDPRHRAAAARNHPSVAIARALDECLDDPSIDAVIVATPASTHHPVALAALRAGKHILVETPFVMDLRHGAELDRVAREAGLVLATGHTYLYDAGIGHMREHVETSQLGDLLYLRCERLSWGLGHSEMNALWNLAPHDVAILLHILAADPSAVTAHGATSNRHDVEDVAFLALEFTDGPIAHIHVSRLDPTRVRQLTAVGSTCSLRYKLTDDGPRIWVHERRSDDGLGSRSNSRTPQSGCQPWEPSADTVAAPQAQCEDFARAIRERTAPVADAAMGLRVTNVLQAASASLAYGGRPVEVPNLARVGQAEARPAPYRAAVLLPDAPVA